MTTLKCKVCGGQIEIVEGNNGICDSCGTKTFITNTTSEQRESQFNRGNALRMRGEFDKAQAVFERLIEQDYQDVEAYWCLILCRYGIEYVEDPKTHTHIPTSHRISYSSILQDSDYTNVLTIADSWMRDTYIYEGKRIAELQKNLLSVSKMEEAYDIFICYKETLESGSRSKDSKLAQEIYYELENQSYRVFFSRISLEDKLGNEYEPYIFAALNSAKVMLVIGTSSENFNAVWVKNEWSRYLSLMKNDRSKTLIPCYRDMDALDLPDELSIFQAQDMGKIGFIQDLIRGINKILKVESTKVDVKNLSHQIDVDLILDRVYICLEDRDYKKAEELIDIVLNNDPRNSKAYIALLLIQLNYSSLQDLLKHHKILTEYPNFQKALKFAKGSYLQEISLINEQVKKSIDDLYKNETYNQVKQLMANVKTNDEFTQVKRLLYSIQGFKDADELILENEEQWSTYCQKLILAEQEAEQKRLLELEQLKLDEERKRFEESRLTEERNRKRVEQAKQNKKNVKGFSLFLVLVLLLFTFLYTSNRNKEYNLGLQLLDSSNFEQASNIFENLGQYKDSEKLYLESKYQQALKVYSTDYLTSIKLFLSLNDYKESNTYVINYRNDIIEQSNDLINQRKLIESQTLVNNALGVLENDTELLRQLSIIDEFKPLNLIEIEPFDEDGNIFFETEYRYYLVSTMDYTPFTDNEGNIYDNGIQVRVGYRFSSIDYIEFDVDGYNKLEGTLILNYEDRDNSKSGYLNIFGDDVLLYKSPGVKRGFLPQKISIDIQSVKILRIEFTGEYSTLSFVEPTLYK